MLIYLYGPDSYRRQKKTAEILSQYQKKYPDAAIEYFSLDQKDDLVRLKDFSISRSLFAKTKLGVVVFAEEAAAKELKETLKGLLETKDTTLLISCEKKLTKEYDFLLKEPVKNSEFEPLEGARLLAYVKKEAEERGLKITDAHIRDAAEAEGEDLWRIMTSLEQLSLGGEAEAAAKVPDFFPMVQILKGALPLSRRLDALYWALEYYEPALVFNMLSSLVGPGAKKLFADYDVSVKSGKLEYPEVLLDFVIAN